MTINCRQCDDATLTKLALGSLYAVDRDNGNIIKFLDRLKLICYESDDSGLSHKLYKVAVAVKSLYNYTNMKPDDPHRFKEELKVKYNTTMAIIGKFPNGTALLEHWLKEDTPNQTWVTYSGMTPAERLGYEEKADNLAKTILLLMNSSNKVAKKDLRLAYAQGNYSA